MRAHFSARLGPRGADAVELLVAGRKPATNSNYSSKLRLFYEFCGEQSIDPLAAETLHLVQYVSWLGARGISFSFSFIVLKFVEKKKQKQNKKH